MKHSIPKELIAYIKPKTAFIFSKSSCPSCVSAKSLFKVLEIPFKEKEVNTNPKPTDNEGLEFLGVLHAHSGIKTFPKIYLGEKCIGGYSDMLQLKKSQKLFEMLKKDEIPFADSEHFRT